MDGPMGGKHLAEFLPSNRAPKIPFLRSKSSSPFSKAREAIKNPSKSSMVSKEDVMRSSLQIVETELQSGP